MNYPYTYIMYILKFHIYLEQWTKFCFIRLMCRLHCKPFFWIFITTLMKTIWFSQSQCDSMYYNGSMSYCMFFLQYMLKQICSVVFLVPPCLICGAKTYWLGYVGHVTWAMTDTRLHPSGPIWQYFGLQSSPPTT